MTPLEVRVPPDVAAPVDALGKEAGSRHPLVSVIEHVIRDRVRVAPAEPVGDVSNSSSSTRVTGRDYVDGLVGDSDTQGAVRESAASAQVDAEGYVGGLVGRNDRTVCDSEADGKVPGTGSNQPRRCASVLVAGSSTILPYVPVAMLGIHVSVTQWWKNRSVFLYWFGPQITESAPEVKHIIDCPVNETFLISHEELHRQFLVGNSVERRSAIPNLRDNPLFNEA